MLLNHAQIASCGTAQWKMQNMEECKRFEVVFTLPRKQKQQFRLKSFASLGDQMWASVNKIASGFNTVQLQF